MAQLDFLAFDADHHYYEAEDAFIRHVDPKLRKRCMQWAEIDGRKRLLVGGKVNRFIPNPTFDPVAKPGILDEFFRGKNPDQRGIAALFGELDPIHPAYRDRDHRLQQLDAQRIQGALLFPTLGVGMEESLNHDPEALLAAFRAFNRLARRGLGLRLSGAALRRALPQPGRPGMGRRGAGLGAVARGAHGGAASGARHRTRGVALAG